MITEILFIVIIILVALKFIVFDKNKDVEKSEAPATTTDSTHNTTFSHIKNDIIFYAHNENGVILSMIRNNIFKVFYEIDEERDDIFDISYMGTVTTNYKSGNKKIILTKNTSSCNIDIYFRNGNTMYKYSRPDNSTIVFNQYSSDGEILFARTYSLEEFSNLLKVLPYNNTVPNDIVLLYRILSIFDLNELIRKNDDCILLVDKDGYNVTLNEIEDSIHSLEFSEQNFRYGGDTSPHYDNDNRKMSFDMDEDNCNTKGYYDGGNIMFEYNWSNNSHISFVQYTYDGEIVTSQSYKVDDFSDLFKSLPQTNTIPHYILILHRVLETDWINSLIELINEHVLFLDERGDEVTLNNIKSDFHWLFDENDDEFDKVLDVNYIGSIYSYYEDESKKIVVDRSTNNCKINVYYDNGNPLFEYHFSQNSDITFTQYYSNGDIVFSKTYHPNDFSDLLKVLPSNNTVPNDILFFYKILDTDGLTELIIAKNKHLLFYDQNSFHVTILGIKDDFYSLFDKIDNKFNSILDKNYCGIISNYSENGNRKIVVDKNMNRCNINIYYENDSLMFEYNRYNDSTIIFNQYSPNGEITSSDTYDLDDFSDLLKYVPKDNTIPNDIFLIYKILDIYELDMLIKINNNKILAVSTNGKDIIKKDEKNLEKEPEIINKKSGDDNKDITQNSNIEVITNTNSDTSNIKDGPFRLYYENNAVKSTGTYKNGKLDGLYMEYHTNGRVKIEGHYENGDKKGLWKFFSDSGTLEREENY